jgi:hypothetical protein
LKNIPGFLIAFDNADDKSDTDQGYCPAM